MKPEPEQISQKIDLFIDYTKNTFSLLYSSTPGRIKMNRKGKAKTPYASHSSIHLVFLLFLYSVTLTTDLPSPWNLEDSAAPHQPTLCMGYHNTSFLYFAKNLASPQLY
ncbi:hypothetical protein EYC84_008411 [Monilinia fructicola]|uniref:Uncharacterized protein n=1 Tax=Monilinia fructicola TaxID=38448 RepID=A0A5M9JF90_MONFR|nr:hypothetical protein EYC84_008411 [Monilinia fructicola]